MNDFEKYLQFKLESVGGKTKALLEEQLEIMKGQIKITEKQERMFELHNNDKQTKSEILEYLNLAQELCKEECLANLDHVLYKIFEDKHMDEVMYYLTSIPQQSIKLENSLLALKLSKENFTKLIPFLDFSTRNLEQFTCNIENFGIFPSALLKDINDWRVNTLAKIIAAHLSRSTNVERDILALESNCAFSKCTVIEKSLEKFLETVEVISKKTIQMLEARNIPAIIILAYQIKSHEKNINIAKLIDEETAQYIIANIEDVESMLSILNVYPKAWLENSSANIASLGKNAGHLFTLESPNWDFINILLDEAAKQTEMLSLPKSYTVHTFFSKNDVPNAIVEKLLKLNWSKKIRREIAFSLLATGKENKAAKINKRDIIAYVKLNNKDTRKLQIRYPQYATCIAAITFVHQLDCPWSDNVIHQPSQAAIKFAVEKLELMELLLHRDKHSEWLAKIPAKYIESYEGIALLATDENIDYLLPHKIKWQAGKTNIIDSQLQNSNYGVCRKLLAKGIKPSKQTAATMQEIVFSKIKYNDRRDQLEDLLLASFSLPNSPKLEKAQIKLLFEKKLHKSILKLIENGQLSRDTTFNGLPVMCQLMTAEFVSSAISIGMSPLVGGTKSPMFSTYIPLDKRIEIFEHYINNLEAKAILTAPENAVEMEMF